MYIPIFPYILLISTTALRCAALRRGHAIAAMCVSSWRRGDATAAMCWCAYHPGAGALLMLLLQCAQGRCKCCCCMGEPGLAAWVNLAWIATAVKASKYESLVEQTRVERRAGFCRACHQQGDSYPVCWPQWTKPWACALALAWVAATCGKRRTIRSGL